MKLFFGNLSWNTDEDMLRNAVEAYGEVEEVRIITDRETGRSRGFGFVTFSNEGDAQQAITELDGKEFDGRVLKVNEAKERQPRPSRHW